MQMLLFVLIRTIEKKTQLVHFASTVSHNTIIHVCNRIHIGSSKISSTER